MPRRPAPLAQPAKAPRLADATNVREQVYEAAVRSFEELGIRRTNMGTVAAAAGVSRQTVYYYFSTKDALLLEIMARRMRSLREELLRDVAPGGVDSLVEAFCYLITVLRHDKYAALMLTPDSMKLTARLSESDLIMGLSREWYGPYLDSASAVGELRSDLHHDDLIRWLLALNFTALTAGEHLGLQDEEHIRTMATLFLRPSLLPTATAPILTPRRRT